MIATLGLGSAIRDNTPGETAGFAPTARVGSNQTRVQERMITTESLTHLHVSRRQLCSTRATGPMGGDISVQLDDWSELYGVCWNDSLQMGGVV